MYDKSKDPLFKLNKEMKYILKLSIYLLVTCWPPLLLGVPLHGRHRRFSRGGVAQFTCRPWPAEP